MASQKSDNFPSPGTQISKFKSIGAPSLNKSKNAPDQRILQPPPPTRSPSPSTANPYATWASPPIHRLKRTEFQHFLQSDKTNKNERQIMLRLMILKTTPSSSKKSGVRETTIVMDSRHTSLVGSS
ncbi:hypothetical protein ACFX15_029588 [Malus domestica]